MGQRSQIYIRFHNKIGTRLIARYYRWNYSERMISRARGIIEELESIKCYPLQRNQFYHWRFDDKDYIEKLTRICDTNFDMRNMVLSTDILKEVHDDFIKDARENGFNKYIFGQDNNDGQLFIDIVLEKTYYAEPMMNIKYAFLGYYIDPKHPLDAEGYMEMNAGSDWETKNLIRGGYNQDEESREVLRYTLDNIKYINEHATLMTIEEIENFINDNYSHLVENL